jgi:adenine phosphoribosyltransferase
MNPRVGLVSSNRSPPTANSRLPIYLARLACPASITRGPYLCSDLEEDVMTSQKLASQESTVNLTLPLSDQQSQWLKGTIRDVPDFPKAGIIFKDLTTLMKDAKAFSFVLDCLAAKCRQYKPTVIVGIEARGFILAPAVARQLEVGFVPVRKPGKLPWQTEKISYALEYGEDSIEVHKDAVTKDDRVIIIDDLLATGGTALAAKQLMQKLNAQVVACGFVVELDFLSGRKKVIGDDKLELFSIIHF